MQSDNFVSQCESVMGNELGSYFGFLVKEYWELCRELEYFQKLYLGSPETVQLLNNAAPDFFGLVQTLLHDSVVLRIGRLCDPAVTGSNANHSLLGLAKLRYPDTKSDEHLALNAKADPIKNAAKEIVAWRNKAVAHTDWQVAQNNNLNPLSQSQLDEILASMKTFLSEVGTLYGFGYLDLPTPLSEASRLLGYLRAAVPEIERRDKAYLAILGQ